VKTGRYADIFTLSRPKTEAELAIFQGMVEWIYGEFIRKVAEGRELDPAEVRRIAGGRVWSGREAVKLGLVDELGGLDAAIAYAAKAAAVEGEYQLTEFPQSLTFPEMVQSLLENVRPAQSAQRNLISQVIAGLKSEAKVLGQFNDPRGIYARLPLEINVR
jgi:protease-4